MATFPGDAEEEEEALWEGSGGKTEREGQTHRYEFFHFGVISCNRLASGGSMMANIWMINEPGEKKKKSCELSRCLPIPGCLKYLDQRLTLLSPFLPIDIFALLRNVGRRSRPWLRVDHPSVVLSQTSGQPTAEATWGPPPRERHAAQHPRATPERTQRWFLSHAQNPRDSSFRPQPVGELRAALS